MINFRKTVLGVALAGAMLAGCNDQVTKDLFQIANVLVNVECGTTRDAVSGVVTNVLNVVGTNKNDVQNVVNVLETNAAIAKALCPAVQTIVAAVGSVSTGTPTVVTVPAKSSAQSVPSEPPFPVIWK